MSLNNDTRHMRHRQSGHPLRPKVQKSFGVLSLMLKLLDIPRVDQSCF